MIVKIDKTHALFSGAEYKKDLVAFSLMEFIKQSPLLLVSNEKNFIIGMSAPQMPVWVWTADGIDSGSRKDLTAYFYHEFSEKNPVHFVAKPEVAALLAAPFMNRRQAAKKVVRMQSYEVEKVIPARNQEVVIENPAESDIGEIAVCMANFEKDCLGKTSPAEAFFDRARSMLENPYFFVVKQGGRVAATAQSARETDTHMAINLVYTRPEYRGNGFASALVAHISKMILAKGKIPALYTDLSNPFSNRAYKSIGFVEKGRVEEVTISWNDCAGAG